jgi:hypothetical protein
MVSDISNAKGIEPLDPKLKIQWMITLASFIYFPW